MTLLRGALLTVALCSGPTALAQSHPDLVVTPAWGGWARPARATELDVRVASDVATRATLTVNAGRQTLRAPLALEPGRPVRLHLPVSSADEIVVTAGDLRQPVAVSRSEAPLLAVALQSGEPVHFADFHAVTVTPDALPRNASAYAAVDALVIDAPTLASLDERQLSALVSDAAQCGRMIVLNADARVRDVLQRAAGCGGTAAVFAGSLTQGLDGFMASLAKALPTAIGTVRPPEIRRTHDATWQRVIALAAGSFIAIALTLVWSRRWPMLAAVPVLATGTVLAFLHALAPVSRVVVWSESESGGQLARYTAWQSLPGTARRSTRTELPPQLRAPTSCDPLQASLLEFDVDSGRAIAAVFDTRLFRPVVICYSGELVAARTVEVRSVANGAVVVRNAGSARWPAGVLIMQQRVLELPALDPGREASLSSASTDVDDGVLRMARGRLAGAKAAALWKLGATEQPDLPVGVEGWWLVALPWT